ncbi:MAG: VWA domain-containing protein [Clostridium sp.]|nr:VWA domain-containing protein [Clostridium sp.]
MKVKFGLIYYVLIVCMLISSISVAASGINTLNDVVQNTQADSGYPQSFPDIEGHWCREYIEKFLSKKWVVGYNDGLFRPNRFVTRAEFTAMAMNIFKKVEGVYECNFTDVKKDDWFYNVVAYAATEGLIQGYENGSFKPMDNMSRQDAAVLAAKLFDVGFFEGAEDYKFKDEDTFPEYSYKSIKNLASHGIIQGYPDGTFRPARLITRAEAVRMLDVVLKYIEVPKPEETIPVAPPETPSPSPTVTSTPTPTPTSTPKPSRNTGGGGTVRDPKPDPTPDLTPDPTLNPTKKPASLYRTYTSSEDFNEGELMDVTSRLEDQLVLQDRRIDQSTGSIQNVYGEKPDSLYIEVTQSVAKSVLMPFGDMVEVNINLKGAGEPLEIKRDPIDLIIAMDNSGSMEWGNMDYVVETPNRMDYAKEASKGVIDLMQSFDRAAVVEFAGSVWVQQELTDDKEVLKQSIDDTPASPWDGTSIGAALSQSIEIIAEKSDAGRQKAILLLSDGADNGWSSSEILQQAEIAKENGIKVYCIGLGSGADQDLLMEISDITLAEYSFSPTMEELEEMMFEVAKEIFDTAGKIVVFETKIEGRIVEDGIIPAPYDIIDNSDGSKTYQWYYDSLVTGEEKNISISFECNESYDVSKAFLMKDSKLRYLDKDDECVEVNIDDVLLPVSRYCEEGRWMTIFDSERSKTKWGSIWWNGKIYNDAALNVMVSSSEDGINYSSPVSVSNYSSFEIPDGRYVKLEVDFKRSTDGFSPELFDITIAEAGYELPEYTNAAPVIEEVSSASGIVGNCVWLVGVVSDDCVSDKEMTFDWEVVGDNAGNVTITNKESFMANAVFSEPGEYIIEFRVNDGEKNSQIVVKAIIKDVQIPQPK